MTRAQRRTIAEATEEVLTAAPGAGPALHASAHESADKPLVTLRPTRGWVALDLRELCRYRELFYFLVWRDVKVRYKQTVLGAAWALLQPLGTMLLFTLLFGRLAQMPSDGVPYALFAYAGLLPWTFFSNAVANSSNSLVGNANLITKVYFPRMIIPGAAVLAGSVDFAIASVVLLPLQIYYRVPLGWQVLLLPFLVVQLALLATGIGMWLSALNVRYRDVRYAQPFLIQLWMFASPIIYPVSLVPEKWRWLLSLNPLTGILEGFRAALFGRSWDGPALAVSVTATVVIFLCSAFSFRRMESRFADEI